MKKNLFFSAAAVLLLTLSCTKELPTENVVAPAGDATEADGLSFTASFESVKSSLNDSQQPIWVAGDAIGVTSAQDNNVQCALTNAATGVFSGANINGSAPYCAVYPWNASFSFAGDVVSASVPAVQQLAGGQKVAPGAMVAACVSNTTTLTFKNCVALMRVDLPRNDIKSVKVETTKEGEYLAGAFTMDAGAATLTVVPDAANASASVTLLPEGSAFAAGSYYIALLPGEYTGLKITFTNTSDQTAVATKSTKTTYARSEGLNWGNFFTYEISSAEALIAWAQASPKFTTWDVVNLSADITLSPAQAAQYVEANNFCGTFNGNNHSIEGLTSPLFGALYGSVSNLSLTANIDYNGTDARIIGTDYGIGILAHYIYKDKNPNASINNVTTLGSLKVNGVEKTHNYLVGGIVGSSNGIPLSGCKNYATVTVDGLSLGTFITRIGGVAGAMQENTNAKLTNCENHGAVTVQSASVKEASIGGIVGYSTQSITISGCINNAAVNGSVTATATVSVAGVAASLNVHTTLINCENTSFGDVTLNGQASYGYAGGIIAVTQKGAKLESPINRGAVTNTGTFSEITRIGGIVGNFVCNSTESITAPYGLITGGKNYGEVKNESATPKQIRIGGLIGAATSGACHAISCENRGNITNVSSVTPAESCLGGLAGYIGTGGSMLDSSLSKCTITNNVTASSTSRAAQILGSNGTAGMTLSNLQLAGSVLGTTLTSSNFSDFIYQGTAPTTAPSNCSFLNE